MPGPLVPLLNEIRECHHCANVLPVPPRPVLQANARARILIASQAPGRAVFETGIPFIDPSGKLLRKWMGVSRELFYDPERIAIVPMGFCYPGKAASGDFPPRPECAERWRTPLLEALPAIELTLAVGSYATAYHTRSRATLTATVQDWRQWSPALIPMPHPSPRNRHWLKRHPWFEAEVIPELQRRVREVLARTD